MDEERLAYVALACLLEPGNRLLGDLVLRGGPQEALRHILTGREPEVLRGAVAARLGGWHPLRLAEAAAGHADRLGARLVTPLDDEWPTQLGDLVRISRPDARREERDTYPPLCLWVRGPLPLASALARSVAVVGSRAATSYGESVAAELSYGLADRGWTVVSGGAYGIDAAAHRGALAGGGATVAVLACGIDRPYPPSNTNLFDRIGDDGLLVTEWPPSAAPHKHRFLIRNRVIAAATRGTVVVEASARSGSRQTLRRAYELGRRPMVVPGPVTSAMSVGTHEALREDGVRLVARVEHILEEVGAVGADLAAPVRGPQLPHDRLDAAEAQVYDALPLRRAAAVEEIAAAAGLSLREALRCLSLLESQGFAVRRSGGYSLPPPPKPCTAAGAAPITGTAAVAISGVPHGQIPPQEPG